MGSGPIEAIDTDVRVPQDAAVTTTRYVPLGPRSTSGIRQALGLTSDPSEFIAYVAFVTPAWLNEVSASIIAADSVVMRIGLDIPATPQQVLIDLREISKGTNRDIQLIRSRSGGLFHPKVYVAKHGSNTTALVGSSNPSVAAFSINVEANLRIQGASGSQEDSEVTALLRDLERRIDSGVANRQIQRIQMPTDPMPIVKPSATRAASPDPEVAATFASDGWEADPGYQAAQPVVSFNSPLSGLYGYAANTGRQAGIYIPAALRPKVLNALAAYGADMILRWRFVTQDGATAFSHDERKQNVVATGKGPASHNLAITANRSRIAIPATLRLKSLGFTDSDRIDAEYRLNPLSSPPELWLMYRMPRASAAINSNDVIS